MAGAIDLTASLAVSDALRATSLRVPRLDTKEKAKAASEEFEAVFLNTMFSQMFSGLEGDGPMGGGKATGVWRSLLVDEYAKSFSKSGGIGLSKDIYRSLLAQQEARSQ
jgi:flagellar protein FlgJ